MKRLLCIVSSMDRGGAETFLMKVYRAIDKKKYQLDFCVNKENGFYDEEIRKMGGRIFVIPPKSHNPFKSFKAIKKIVKDNNYKYVLRTSQQSLATIDLIAAKKGGADVLIYRSSNAGMTGGFIKRFINKLFGFLPRVVPNIKIAPSVKAATFVFGKKAVKNNEILILNNGLDYNIFKYDEKKRIQKRKELKIEDKTILYGHVGRFNSQKNHLFLIDVFNEICKRQKNSMLLLIGEGEEKEKVIKYINELNLSNKVIILEPQANVQDYYMAMDLFVFPSLFEGMPNVIIEAQATGLRCILSDTITEEADVSGLLKYISLNKSAIEWADEILSNNNYKRVDTYKSFKDNGYLIDDVVNVFKDNILK